MHLFKQYSIKFCVQKKSALQKANSKCRQFRYSMLLLAVLTRIIFVIICTTPRILRHFVIEIIYSYFLCFGASIVELGPCVLAGRRYTFVIGITFLFWGIAFHRYSRLLAVFFYINVVKQMPCMNTLPTYLQKCSE